MKRNDPYSRVQRQRLSTLGITIPLLTLLAVLQIFNPRTELFMYPMVTRGCHRGKRTCENTVPCFRRYAFLYGSRV